MTSVVAPRRVARSPEVVLGPGLLRGATPTYAIKDGATGRRYEVGPREFFVLSRLDGQRSLSEIGDEYARTFNRRLDDAAWAQLLGLFAARNLLAGQDRTAIGAPATKPRRGLERLGPLRGQYVFGDPSALMARIYRRLAWLYRPVVLGPLLVALIAMDVYLAVRSPDIVTGVSTLVTHPPLVVLGLILLWSATAVHEFGHGITCRHYGGNASAIGVRWFGPIVAAFCSVDDMHLFPARRARVATAAAGVIAGQLFLLPFFALWLWAPLDGVTHAALGVVLLLGVAPSLLSYLPVAPMDGYHMLGHLLNISNLGPESRRYLRLRLRALLRGGPAPAGYPRWVRPVYVAYGIASLMAVTAVVVVVAWWAYAWPPARVVVLVAGGVALYAFARRHLARRKQQKGRQA